VFRHRTSDIKRTRVIDGLSVYMADGHMSHEKYEAEPWHVVIFNIFCNQVCSRRADKQRSDACPKIEESNKIEQRYTVQILVNAPEHIFPSSRRTL